MPPAATPLLPVPRRAWRLLFALMLVAITTLALLPEPPTQINLGWDKLNHASAFASLAVVITLGWGRRWWRHGAGLLAYGGLIEVLQSMTPTRSAEWADLLADGLGLGVGQLLVAGLLAAADRWRRRGHTPPAQPAQSAQPPEPARRTRR